MAKGTGLQPNTLLQVPDFVQAVVLASSVGQAFDVPAGMRYVAFSMNADFWVKYGSTAALIPSTSTTAGTSSPELNPTARDIRSTSLTTGLSIIAPAATSGSMAWYT